jgi:mannose-1-phosphate guanylyltransferase/mannose-6-phosphate isomerase
MNSPASANALQNTLTEENGAPINLYTVGECDQRPWGSWELLDAAPGFAVKRLVVNPGHKLSLQRHHHRGEHWIVVKGTALVTRDAEVLTVKENENVVLPLGCVHRLENPGLIPLVLIEVQIGSYLAEDDIIRIEDTYGRQ